MDKMQSYLDLVNFFQCNISIIESLVRLLLGITCSTSLYCVNGNEAHWMIFCFMHWMIDNKLVK